MYTVHPNVVQVVHGCPQSNSFTDCRCSGFKPDKIDDAGHLESESRSHIPYPEAPYRCLLTWKNICNFMEIAICLRYIENTSGIYILIT
jgi:hypothetical protein